jgi:hypothetical protein
MDHSEVKEQPCRSCGRPIIFIELESGRFNPCEPGLKTVQLEDEGKIAVLVIGGKKVRSPKAGDVGYVDHFPVCDHPELFRKKQ